MSSLRDTKVLQEKIIEKEETMGEELLCRICLDTAPRNNLIAPCACKGSSKWVHRECLDQWRTTREDNKAFSKCTVCMKSYVLVSLTDDNPVHERERKYNFYTLVIRDIGLAVIGCVVIVLTMSFVVWASDRKSGYLLGLFHGSRHPKTFYVLAGTVVTLSIIGLLFLFFWSCRGESYTNHGLSMYDIYFINAMDPSSCSCCCTCCEGHAAASGAASSGGSATCCDCLTAGVGNSECCCACHEGAGTCFDCAALGEMAIPVFVVAGIILAVIGLFVSIFLGAIFAEQVVERHLKILYKRNMSKDFVVADLESMEPEDVESGQLGTPSNEINNNNPLHQHSSVGGLLKASGLSEIGVELPYRSLDNRSVSNGNVYHQVPSEAQIMDRDMISDELEELSDDNANKIRLGNNPHASLLSVTQKQELVRAGLI